MYLFVLYFLLFIGRGDKPEWKSNRKSGKRSVLLMLETGDIDDR